MKQKGFTLVELLVVISILGILAVIGLTTFNHSQIKGRDAQRKSNLAQVARALELYNNDKGKYPAASNGSIMGCGAGATSLCSWGTGQFSNTTTGTIYMATLPQDPSSSLTYYYESTGNNKTYKLYAYLENTNDSAIITTTFTCGTKTCNYGVSSTNTTP